MSSLPSQSEFRETMDDTVNSWRRRHRVTADQPPYAVRLYIVNLNAAERSGQPGASAS